MPPPVDRWMAEATPLLEIVAERIARRLGHRLELEDLMALGRPALIEIARTYDPTRSRFVRFATSRIQWAIIDGVRRETRWRSAHARADALAASELLAEACEDEDDEDDKEDDPARLPSEQEHEARLGALLAAHAAAMALGLLARRADPEDTPEERAAAAELAGEVRRAVRALPQRERALIERHYFGGERFDRIAEELGISKSWASRLHAQGLRRLGEALALTCGCPAP